MYPLKVSIINHIPALRHHEMEKLMKLARYEISNLIEAYYQKVKIQLHGSTHLFDRSSALLQVRRRSAALPCSIAGVKTRSACQSCPISARSRQ